MRTVPLFHEGKIIAIQFLQSSGSSEIPASPEFQLLQRSSSSKALAPPELQLLQRSSHVGRQVLGNMFSGA